MTAPTFGHRLTRPTSGDRHLHWETALDRLELEVIYVERMLLDPDAEHEALEPWDEPQLQGPVPADLMDRAVAIRSRQERAERALSHMLDRNRRQHQFAARVDRATGGRAQAAIYLDVDA